MLLCRVVELPSVDPGTIIEGTKHHHQTCPRFFIRGILLDPVYYQEETKSSRIMTAAAAGENDNNGDEIQMDEQFRQRVQQSFVTVQAWENNEELLRRCREELVPDAFYNNNKKKKTEREAVQILVQHFQTKVMTWVNHPLCENCGGTTTAAADHNVRHVTTTTGMPLDADGAMCRVEVYRCKTCDQLLEFPRYNSIVRLLQSRQGRCGEYANLFGCLCRAVGLETRYILDFTDHGE